MGGVDVREMVGTGLAPVPVIEAADTTTAPTSGAPATVTAPLKSTPSKNRFAA